MSEQKQQNTLNSFFTEEYDRLKSYVRSKIEDSAERDAEDIIQDVALKLITRPGSYTSISNLAGFVYNALRNKIVDGLRTKKVKSSVDDESEERLTNFMDLIYGRSDNAYSDEMKRALLQSIKTLKPHYQEVIMAIDFEGYSYSELAHDTNTPEGTLMSRRHRALSLLHKQLKKTKELENDELF